MFLVPEKIAMKIFNKWLPENETLFGNLLMVLIIFSKMKQVTRNIDLKKTSRFWGSPKNWRKLNVSVKFDFFPFGVSQIMD